MNRKILKYCIVGVILISLLFFISMTDLKEVQIQIQKIGFGFFWLLSASFFAYASGSLSWKYCFNDTHIITLHRLFYIRTVGELITLFNPSNIVAGEASKFYLLKNVSLSKEDKLDSIILSRIVLMSSQIVLAVFCCFWLSYYYSSSIFFMCGSIILILVLLIILGLTNGRHVLKLLGRSRFRFLRICYIQLHNIQGRLGLFIDNHKARLGLSFQWATVHWLCGALEIYLILYYLGLDPLIMHCITVDTGVVVIKSVMGFIPGQIGVEELSNKWLLSLVGIQGASVWITVSILRRAKQLIWICISTIFYFIDEYLVKQKTTRNGNIICDA